MRPGLPHVLAAAVVVAVGLAACAGGELDGGVVSSSASPNAGSGGANASTAGAAGAASGAGGSLAGAAGMSTSTAGQAGAADMPQSFIAFAESFADFRSWPAYPLGELPPTTNEIAGPRTIYINQLPPPGATRFPVGTMIVKAIEVGDPATWQVFAMAKRGDDFNSLGAQGWEWFELSLKFDACNIVWRGVAPPNGMGYGGGVSGGICNTCHLGAAANDYVQDGPLQLFAP